MSTFQEKADQVNKLATKPSDDELLSLYGLFKQATVGDVNTDRPGIFALKDRYKWDAWKKNEGLSKEEAEKKYIDLVDELINKYGLK
ncbi:CYFA0S21e00364g1_1 [Cyberlindnera fabianii]|uniref:Acyl-CoA-binding protein n=1 Tax=Cyberlindnera fabianii TaxID=36022 RepID=A0A061B7V3_CYBFA|nr:Acyl-CoA-binding protein [Cyberlindnera fabianii]CDR45990.1 CYFA0S21e00364g1_1 [Cyberlindnera fabianii]